MFDYDDLTAVLNALLAGTEAKGERPFERRMHGSPLGGYWVNDLVDGTHPYRGQAISYGLMAEDALFYSEAHFQLLFAIDSVGTIKKIRDYSEY